MKVSRTLRLPLVALAVAFASYGTVALGLNRLANWAELHAYAHPYEPGEEAFRFLSPAFVGRPGDKRIMLIGSSTAQEGLLYERFEQAFPGYDAYQVSYGEATLDGVLVALDYIEGVYGEAAIPGTLVVGLDARAIANLPRAFGPQPELEPPRDEDGEEFEDEDGDEGYDQAGEDESEAEDVFVEDWSEDGDVVSGSYLFAALNRYSPYYSVEATDEGSVLVPKSFRESLAARWSLMTAPQQPRHRSAVVALLNHWINGPGPGMDWAYAVPAVYDVRNPIEPRSLGTFFAWFRAHPAEAVRGWLAAYTAPYFHRYRVAEEYEEWPGGEGGIHWWDPHSEEEMVLRHLGRLRDFADEHDSKLFLVVMPEHPWSADDYPEESYQELLEITREGLGNTLIIDLRTAFEVDDFVDDAHLDRQAAVQATDRIIREIEEHGGLER